SLKRELIVRLATLFHPASQVYGDYQNAIEVWYKDLQDYQKDPHAYSALQQQVPFMLQYLPKINSLEETFWEDLPGSVGFGFGKVDTWTFDRSKEYFNRFEQGLKAIAECRPPIPDPEWKVEGGKANVTDYGLSRTVEYSGKTRLKVSIPCKVSQVFLTSNDDDPRESDAQRVQINGDWAEVVEKNAQLKLVSRTADGEYGRVIEIHFRNQDLRYRVQPAQQLRLGEREYTFIMASDSSGVRMTFESLLQEIMERSGLSNGELAELLRALAEGLVK
ncbi:MAG: hypothetical protein ACYC0V_16810, partial [Armatimonadota bacterium]